MTPYFDNDYAAYKLHDGILYITYHRGVYIDLPAAVQIVKDRLLLHEGRQLPVLCDIRGIKEANKSARVYLAMEGSILVKAVAFLVETPVSEMMSKFYVRTSTPPIATQSFEHQEQALSFLNKFKDNY